MSRWKFLTDAQSTKKINRPRWENIWNRYKDLHKNRLHLLFLLAARLTCHKFSQQITYYFKTVSLYGAAWWAMRVTVITVVTWKHPKPTPATMAVMPTTQYRTIQWNTASVTCKFSYIQSYCQQNVHLCLFVICYTHRFIWVNNLYHCLRASNNRKSINKKTTKGRSINDVIQFSHNFRVKLTPSPSVTLGHKSWTPLPKLCHELTTLPLQKGSDYCLPK